MKVTVSFELDLANAPAFNATTLKELKGCLQNLSDWLHELHCVHLQKITSSMAHPHPEPFFQAAILAHNEADAAVSAQLFDNYRVVGTTDDGHTFDCHHTKPYTEVNIIDGKEMYLE